MSKGGVNVYWGRPQSLKKHMSDCLIDCEEKDIRIEILLKICANDFSDPYIDKMRMVTRNVHDTYRNQQAFKEMIVKQKNISNYNVKISLSSIWYLMQRLIIVYYSTLSVILLAVILLYTMMAYINVKFYKYNPSEFRDCRFENSTKHCKQLINTMTDSKDVNYELASIFTSSTAPFVLIGLWTSLVLANNIKVFLWEYHNGKYLFFKRIGAKMWGFPENKP